MGMFSGILALIAFILAIIALYRNDSDRRQLQEHRERLNDLQDRLAHLNRPVSTTSESPPISERQQISEEISPQKAPTPPPPPILELKPVRPEQPLAPASALTVTESQSGPTDPLESPAEISLQNISRLSQPVSREDRLGQLEKTLGLRWTIWVGGVVLFLGAGLFVKYAFEQSWLGPMPRVILGVLSGLAIVVAGERCLRRRMPILGQGLIGVGLAILYASLYGAYALYAILPQPVTFMLMILVTAGGLTLAVWRNAMAISVLALLGGFLTPVLVSSGHDSRDALFSYLLLLDVGVLTVAFFKQWRGLDVLAFVGTAILFIGWYEGAHRQASFQLWPAFLWQLTFFLLFLAEPFVYHLRQSSVISGERFCLAVTNAFGMFAWSYHLLYPDHRMILGFVTLGMSLVYLALGVITHLRQPRDSRAVLGFASLFLALLVLTVPICLDLRAVTIAWAVQGPLLLVLAYRYQYLPIRLGSLAPLALATGRLFWNQWPWPRHDFIPIFNATFGTAFMVVVALLAAWWIHQRYKDRAHPLDEWAQMLLALGAGFLLLTSLHIEIWQWLDSTGHDTVIYWACALVWIAGGLGFAWVGLRLRALPLFFCTWICMLLAFIFNSYSYLAHQPMSLIVLNGRFVCSLLLILEVFLYGTWWRRFPLRYHSDQVTMTRIAYTAGTLGLFLLLNAEIYVVLSHHIRNPATAHWVTQMSLSILWSLYATVLLVIGFWRRVRVLRLAALALFGGTALKLVLFDLAGAEELYRIVSFIGLGLLMIAASYLYHRVEKKLHPAGES